jgi:hypothetical protein
MATIVVTDIKNKQYGIKTKPNGELILSETWKGLPPPEHRITNVSKDRIQTGTDIIFEDAPGHRDKIKVKAVEIVLLH